MAIVEVSLLLGVIVLPLFFRKKRKPPVDRPCRIRPDLSDYVVTAEGKIELVSRPRDLSMYYYPPDNLISNND